MFCKHVSLLISLTAVTVVSSASAQAEVKNSADAGTTTPSSFQDWESVTTTALPDSGVTPEANIAPLAFDATGKPAQEATAGLSKVQPVKSAGTVAAELTKTEDADRIAQPRVSAADGALNIQPVPGTITTSAANLKIEPSTSALQQTTSEIQDSKVAQTDININPGRATRAGSSYIGVAGNIGLGGDTALGESNLAVISKIGLTRTFSARPAALIGDNTTFLIPITYDFSLQRGDEPLEPARFAPYLGAGISLSAGDDDEDDDSNVGFLATGGIDFPLTSQLTGTASVNASFKGDTEVGLLIGVGYNFRGL